MMSFADAQSGAAGSMSGLRTPPWPMPPNRCPGSPPATLPGVISRTTSIAWPFAIESIATVFHHWECTTKYM